MLWVLNLRRMRDFVMDLAPWFVCIPAPPQPGAANALAGLAQCPAGKGRAALLAHGDGEIQAGTGEPLKEGKGGVARPFGVVIER
jgi:hypothetical protein